MRRCRILVAFVCIIAQSLVQQAFAQVKIKPAPWLGMPAEMKLLNENTGWVLTRGGDMGYTSRLMWTSTAGAEWREIMPQGQPHEQILSVFFLNETTGWLLRAASGPFDEPIFDVASTRDTGRTWSISPLSTIPGIAEEHVTIAGSGQLVFADTQHGLMNLDIVSGSAFSFAWLLITSDGGRSWRAAPGSPGTRGLLTYITPDDAWLSGDLDDGTLYATLDGSKSWHKVSLPAPHLPFSPEIAVYDRLLFRDSRHSFIAVTFSDSVYTKSAVVLFKTSDGGVTWRIGSTITGLSDFIPGNKVVSTVTDSTWIIAKLTSEGVCTVSSIDITSPQVVEADRTSSYFIGNGLAKALSFSTPTKGWLLTRSGQLLSTADGGATWLTITPGHWSASNDSDNSSVVAEPKAFSSAPAIPRALRAPSLASGLD
ncbi:MAG: WD40/YVTN/BNR-like repeat-containing protein [Candidatus Binataceae bacterium]